MYILKVINNFIKQKKITLLIYIIFTILAYPLESIVIPQIYSKFFSELDTKKVDKSVFIKYFLIIVFFLVIVNLSNYITSYIEAYIIPQLNEYVTNYIFRNLLIKYENNYTDLELGKIITRLNTIPQYLKEVITDICVWIFPRTITVIIINIYFFFINWKLGLVSTILLIIFFYFNISSFKKCSGISNERHILYEKENQNIQDKLSNLYSIYSYGTLNNEIKKYRDRTKIYSKKFTENLQCLNMSINITNGINVLIFIVLNSLTTYLYLQKSISLNNLIAVFITIIYYTPCITTLSTTLPDLIHYYGSLKAVDNFIEELYSADAENMNNKRVYDTEIKKGSIIINNLSFGYNNKQNIFKNFYLTIKDGQKIAIVGSSGNGKSTLIKLIMGYYKVPDNSIFIDNVDINNYNLSDLRGQISFVNQNNKLFNISILENIQYGNDLTKDEILEICVRLNIDNIFKNLENGLDSNVGVDGDNLSGGQRQMIHFLRCIGRKNKIIILDEPTAAIDKENTINVVKAIEELGKNNTVILITHDDSILHIVDRIVTLDEGKIINDEYTNVY